MVSKVKVFMRVREVSEDAGSLKAMYPAQRFYLCFIRCTFRCRIRSVAVQDVDVLGFDVHVVEKVGPHECVVALRMLFRDAAVFVHVEGHHVGERNFPCPVEGDQFFVGSQRCGTGRKSQYERFLCGRRKNVDFVGDVVGGPFRNMGVVGFDNQSHIFLFVEFIVHTQFEGTVPFVHKRNRKNFLRCLRIS